MFTNIDKSTRLYNIATICAYTFFYILVYELIYYISESKTVSVDFF